VPQCTSAAPVHAIASAAAEPPARCACTECALPLLPPSRYFEGTGSLVLDRVNGVAYVGLSERADEALARQWAEQLGYQELVTFRWGGRVQTQCCAAVINDWHGLAQLHARVALCSGAGSGSSR
jgi:hypothetical protein